MDSARLLEITAYWSFWDGDVPMTVPRDVEPLSHFLLERIPAHCEFFASGAVALLRYQGVPCRYVTGYVVTELESEYGDYWIARNRNAHAWVEAYDDENNQWVIVEPTPGVNVRINAQIIDSEGESISSSNDSAGEGGDGDGWFANSWLNSLTPRTFVSGSSGSITAPARTTLSEMMIVPV